MVKKMQNSYKETCINHKEKINTKKLKLIAKRRNMVAKGNKMRIQRNAKLLQFNSIKRYWSWKLTPKEIGLVNLMRTINQPQRDTKWWWRGIQWLQEGIKWPRVTEKGQRYIEFVVCVSLSLMSQSFVGLLVVLHGLLSCNSFMVSSQQHCLTELMHLYRDRYLLMKLWNKFNSMNEKTSYI